MRNIREATRKFFDGLKKSAKLVADYLAEELKLSTERDKLAREQTRMVQRQIQAQQIQNYYTLEYNSVGNAVLDGIRYNYKQCGLDCPNKVSDIYCNNQNLRVSVNTGGVDFRYEAHRLVSDMYLGGMKRHEYPRVPSAKIEGILKEELPKYMQSRGYDCAVVNVDDYRDDNILIILRRVCRI